MKRIKIIVVDDHELFRSGMESLLKKNIDFEVHEGVGTQSELDKILSAEQIDIVLLDIIMPGMSGKEVFEKIRGINPNAKIIITSGYSKQQITESLIASGANGFLPKPFNIDKLLGLIKALYNIIPYSLHSRG